MKCPLEYLHSRSAKKDVDSGEYICTATGINGQTASGTLRVVIKVMISMMITDQNTRKIVKCDQSRLPVTTNRHNQDYLLALHQGPGQSQGVGVVGDI